MHVLLSTTPIPAHTLNASAFVSALVRAGADVTWHAPAGYHAAISALGATPVDVVDAWDPASGDGIPAMGTLREGRRGYARDVVGRAEGRARDVLRLIARRRPDVVLSDTLAYGAGLAAERAGIPWATYGDGPVHDRDPDTPPFGAGLPYRTGAPYRLRNTVVHRASDLAFAGSRRGLARSRHRLGLPPQRCGVLAAGVSPRLHLQGGVPGLEYPRRRRLAPGIHFVGSLYRRPAHAVLPSWLDELGRDGRPVVAVTQGSLRLDTSELIEPTLAALADADCTVVVAAGAAEGARRVAQLPTGRARLRVAAHIPYDALVERAEVFVTNGGWVGVTTALAHGVPVVQVGRTEEKADIGRRVEWSRSGVSIRSVRPRPAQVARALHLVRHDPRIRAGAASLRAEFDRLDAGSLGVTLLRACIEHRTPAEAA